MFCRHRSLFVVLDPITSNEIIVRIGRSVGQYDVVQGRIANVLGKTRVVTDPHVTILKDSGDFTVVCPRSAPVFFFTHRSPPAT